ncbi:eotaxin-like [Gambusia affinis]|uniref:eotaxin-like n=1 Tax=Gambusia affinis TaxID=33528 RepID=UPI001CDB7DA7|nr:eotaxin-like [Gambusia affinis]
MGIRQRRSPMLVQTIQSVSIVAIIVNLVIMKAANILLLCMLGAALLSTVLCHSGNMPADCCFSFVKQRMDKNLMSSYHKTDHRCSLSGIILTTKRGRSICVDPEQPWVNTIIDFLNKKPR